MTESLVKDETPAAFFKEQLEKAMEHQRVSTSAFTEYYLVNLLAHCVHKDGLPEIPDETPLALIYIQALQASRFERARLLRTLGDTALFVSGFFGASLARSLVDFAYYRTLGGKAYRSLSEAKSPFSSDVFGELAGRFMEFADLFSEVSEASHLTSNQSVIQLYERWEKTGSPRSARLLAELGLAPVLGSGTRQ
jgi:hypothetical protein